MSAAPDSPTGRVSRRDVLMVGGGVLIAVLAITLWTVLRGGGGDTLEETEPTSVPSEAASATLNVPPDVLKAAAVEVTPAVRQPRMERVVAPGVVEPNELQIQDVTPLVSGRVERVFVVEGSAVQAGTVLLTMSSPEVAELQGSARAAQARLVEAATTLARTQRLVGLGAGAGKDLVAADAAQRAAQAEVAQLEQRLDALGVPASSGNDAVASVTSVRAPSAATVLERRVNAGQWIEPGTAVMTLGNLSTVWVMVNLPEARLPAVPVGAPVDIRVAALDGALIRGRVDYIESQLDTETRTARVRVDVANPGQRLKIGMFVEASIGGRRTGDDQLMIPSAAVQRIGERSVVFVPAEKAGSFEIRDVELGEELGGSRVILTGLREGEHVVSHGGFTLKSQLLKGQFGEDEELAD